MSDVTYKLENLPEPTTEELNAIDRLQEKNIDFSDIPQLSKEFFQKAKMGDCYRPVKRSVTIRLDADILLWLKSTGKGYQTRINSILRKAMLASPAQ